MKKIKDGGAQLSKLKSLKDYVALAMVDAQKYQKTNAKIIKAMVQEDIPGVYVTLNIPFDNIKRFFEKEKIDLNKIIFIDGVTKTVSGRVKKTYNCLFTGGPKNLSDISIAMDQAVMAIPKDDKFLFFDSLSTLLIYHNVDVVAKFIHFLSGKMRVWKVRGIIISLRREKDKELIDELKSLCDVTLTF